MTMLDSIGQVPMIRALCWMILHFLWQGAAVAMLLWLVRRIMRRHTPHSNYAVSFAALIVCAIMPAVTLFLVYETARAPAALRVLVQIPPPAQPAGLPRPAGFIGPTELPSNDSKSTAPITVALDARIDEAAPIIVTGWACGAVLLALWRLGGWLWAHQLRRSGREIDDGIWRARLVRLQKLLGISRTVRLVASQWLDCPAVIGWIKPAILLPAGCLANLPPAQLDAILAHELAHIRRQDYLANLIQTMLETALFFHPAVWWISGRITDDREDCCDDLAAQICGDRLAYAKALTAMEELRAAPSMALAATGGVLLRRIRRIVGASDTTTRGTWWPVGAVAMAMVVLLTIQTRTPEVGAQPTQPSANSRSIDVVCLDEAGNPVPGAEVYFVGESGGQSGRIARTGTSDQDGRLKIDGLPERTVAAGYQAAYARVPGKLAGVGQKHRDHPNFPADPELVVSLRPVVPYRGTLTLPEGIDPTTVRATLDSIMGPPTPDTPYAQYFHSGADTDRSLWPELFDRPIRADGTFEFADLPDDSTVYTKISGPKIATRIVQWSRNRQPGQVTALIEPEGILEGKVMFDPPGGLLAGLILDAISHDSRAPDTSRIVGHSAKLGEDGGFRLTGLVAGTYRLTVRDLPAGWISAGLQARVLRGDTVRDAVVRIERGIVLSGVVVDADTSEPLPGATVVARILASGGDGIAAGTEADGRFVMRVPSTPISISVQTFPDGYAPRRDPVTRALIGRPPRIQLDLSDPAIAADVPVLEIRLSRNDAPALLAEPAAAVEPATARGRVVDAQGRAVAKVRVIPEYAGLDRNGRSRPSAYRPATTNADGSFELEVYPLPDDPVEFIASIPKWNSSAAISRPFRPEPGETIDVGSIVVTPLPVVSHVAGVLQDEKRRPVSNARITIGTHVQTITGSDGRFRIDLHDRDDAVELMVMAPAFQPGIYRRIPAGADNVILTLLPRGVAGARVPPSPLRLIGQDAPAVNVFQWFANPPGPDPTLPLVRNDGRRTVLLFPECCVAPSVYQEQVAAFDRLCRTRNVAGAVIFEPLFQEHTLRLFFDQIDLDVPVGIDQPTDQGYLAIYGLTKSRYGTIDRSGHTILIISADGKVVNHLTTLEQLEAALGQP